MKVQRINSSHLKEISKLKLKKYREETNSFLIESEKILIEAINSDWEIEEVYLTPENQNLINSFKKFETSKEIKIFELSEKEFKKISNETTPSGIAAKIKKKKFYFTSIFDSSSNIIPVFERISDPGNLGTIIRTADWFGIKSIVLSEESVEYTNPKVVKASMGSIFHLQIFEEVNLASFLELAKKNNYRILGTSTNGKNIASLKFDKKTILVFGNESRGISKEILAQCEDILSIPSYGKAESLNLAISASIIFYEISRK